MGLGSLNFHFWKGAGSRTVLEAEFVSPTWESSSPPFTHSDRLPTNDDGINEAGEEWDSREREESVCA